MLFQGIRGPVDLSIEQIGNKVRVTPKQGVKLLLVDACNAVLDHFKISGAKEVTVSQSDGPTLNIMSSQSRELFTADHEYREAPMGALYEVAAASMGGR